MSELLDDTVPTREKVLVVGAGPAGLAAAAALKALGVPFDLVDRSPDVGGIWHDDRVDTPVWSAMEMISSTAFTQYEDLLQPASYPAFLNPAQMAKYLRAYAARYNLTDHFQPRTEVEHARPFEEGRWQVTLSNGRIDVYRAIVAAHGIASRPHVPEWAQGADPERVIHAWQWTGSAGLEGRRVLVVGSGQSAADIAVDAARRAQEVRWSARSGHWVVPRTVGPLPGDVVASREPALLGRLNTTIADAAIGRLAGNPASVGLPAPRASVLEDRVIVSDDVLDRVREGRITPVADVRDLAADGTVTLTDGATWTPDLIVLATGYESGADYLDEDVLPTTADGAPDLFLGAFPRHRDDLVVLGQVRVNGGVLPVLVEQADIAAYFLHAVATGDPRAEDFRRVRSGGDAGALAVAHRRQAPTGLRGRVRRGLESARRQARRTPAPQAVTERGQLPLSDRAELLERLRGVREIFD
ncbi:NAD(P)-binding domain-containing protein [Brachybacterium sp. EF45031]|uniref:flavin-containing monooxygenase n=1 Tax=Brachybacterium sillae TaxID=2810536 RepID=UPI00217E37A9|nr:NAD(P)-binding domain-containing protein [Brachybacterium sillae]MCS6712189.1 NAD(P)-binding domain-containing protein [Brachybacterium sillae]